MKKQRRTQAGAGIAAIMLAVLLCMPLAALAGTLEPTAAPGPTMHTLDEIYHKLSTIQLQNNLIMKNAGYPRFLDNGDGTVTDSRTGLIWLQNSNPCDVKRWSEAIAWCAALASGQAGLADGSTAGQWRLPTKYELEGLITDPPATWESGIPPATWTRPGTPFTNLGVYSYWSSTTNAQYTDLVWVVDFNYGGVFTMGTAQYCYVRAVRSGQ